GKVLELSPAHKNIILRYDALFSSINGVLNREIGYATLSIILMYVLYVFLTKQNENLPTGISTHRSLFILAAGPLLWWLAVPKQAAPMMVTHIKQLVPFISLLFSLTVTSAWKYVRYSNKEPLMRFIVSVAFISIIIAPAWSTLKYVRRFPNADMMIRLLKPTTLTDVYSRIEICRKIKQSTAYGNLIMVPVDFMNDYKNMREEMIFESTSFYEYFSQRRMAYIGNNRDEFKKYLDKYSSLYKEKVPKFNKTTSENGLRIYALIEKKEKEELCEDRQLKEFLLSKYPEKIKLDDKWILIRVY
ncbi:MAG: hypothetical protein AB1633_10850, partial [Elusimicrobiota bacterium]